MTFCAENLFMKLHLNIAISYTTTFVFYEFGSNKNELKLECFRDRGKISDQIFHNWRTNNIGVFLKHLLL